MPRIRTIKPDFWSHEILGCCSEPARLLAIALLNFADDEGYFRCPLNVVSAFAFPMAQPSRPIGSLLRELVDAKYLSIGSDQDGRLLAVIVNFTRHQRICRPSPSILAPLFQGVLNESSMRAHGILIERSNTDCIAYGRETPAKSPVIEPETPDFIEDSLSPQGALIEDSSLERKGKERKGKDTEGPVSIFDFLSENWDTAENRQAWNSYENHRRQLHVPAYREEGLKALAAKLNSKSSPETFPSAVQTVISSNWRGFADGAFRKQPDQSPAEQIREALRHA